MTVKTTEGVGGANLRMIFLERSPWLLLSQSSLSSGYDKKKLFATAGNSKISLILSGIKLCLSKKFAFLRAWA
jgi:hypothetical protein